VEQFDDHEIVYTLRIPAASNVSLRVRYALDDLPNPIYHLRYVASADLDKSQNVSVRQFHDCCVTKNIQLFLQELGFAYDYEFYAKGDIYRKGRMKITVAKISTVNSNASFKRQRCSHKRSLKRKAFREFSSLSVIDVHSLPTV
jgi:mediator of RNA polymerase II transcription subunit 18